jgi:hypothetical protein
MQPLTKQKYFYYIAFMLMASTFLPVVFNNLPPFVRSHHIWTTIWIVSLLVFNSKIFFNKAMAYLLFYGFLLFIATETVISNIDDWNYRRLFSEYYEILIGLSVITYFLQSEDYKRLAKLTKWSIVFICITAGMTIISSAIDPMYARNIVGISAVTDLTEKLAILSFKKYGGGNYSTASTFMCLFPILIYYYKNTEISLLKRGWIIAFAGLIFLALIGMQLFGNILIAVSFGFIALLGMNKLSQSMIMIVLVFSIMLIIPRAVYVNSLLSISEYFVEGSEVNYKFKDLALFIETGANVEDNNTGTGGRVERYPLLFETFIKKPLGGCYFMSDNIGNGYKGEGAHLYWMNKLTITGIIGLLFFIVIPYNFIKNRLKDFSPQYKFYYTLASLSILVIGIMKVIGGRDTWYTFFIILPGLYYLPELKKY